MKSPKKLAIVFAMLLLAVSLGITAYATVGQGEPPGPVHLTVFLYDNCGGCGVGLLGCGACDEQDRLHLLILSQFGERLHDGSIVYRLLNTRLPQNEESRVERNELYGLPEHFQSMLPVAFIGSAYDGIFLIGDESMPFVKEMLDRYLAGEDVETLQREAISLMNLGGGAPCCI